MPITPKASFTKEDKYIWGAEEIYTLGDERLEYIHQFRAYETDKGWNVTVQAMIPSVMGYAHNRWVTNRRYFKKRSLPNVKTVKDAVRHVAELPSMIDPLTREYEGYKDGIKS